MMLTAYETGRHATTRGALIVLAALVAYGVYVNTLEEGTVWEYIGNLLFLLALMVVIRGGPVWPCIIDNERATPTSKRPPSPNGSASLAICTTSWATRSA